MLARVAAAALLVALSAVALGTEPDLLAQGAKSCPKGQVAITLAGKKSCQPLGRAFPKPRKGDERVVILQALLGGEWGGSPPDLKNRRPPTLRDLLEPFGPAAYAAAAEGVTQIPKTIDRLLGRKARRLAGPRATWAAAGVLACKEKGPKLSDSNRKDLGNGAAFELRVSLGDSASAGFSIEGKAKDGSDRTVRWDVDFGLCDQNVSISLPSCPTAEGSIDGSGSTRFTLTVSTLKNGAVEHSEKVEFSYKLKLKGQVAVDAKLDWVDVEHTLKLKKTASRQSILWGPASEEGTARRSTRVNMRTGTYDRGTSSVVDVRFSYSGILSLFVQDRLAQQRISSELAKKSDELFAQTVADVIKEYRARENAWQTPNTCATLEFAPASRTLRLRDGQRGTLKGTIKAKLGGVAKDGRWRRTGQRNVDVTPTQASGAQPSFSYRVTNADRVVSASFRATSPAGVAAGDWVQGGEDFPARFSGTFTGENRTALRNTYSGTIAFVREPGGAGVVSYKLERVSWRHTVSPLPGSPCQANATTNVTASPGGLTLGVLVIQKDRTAKGYGYAITASFASPRQLTIRFVCNGVESTQPWVPGGALNSGPPGTSLTGTGNFTDGNVIRGRLDSQQTASTYTWNLKGSG
jgi:hypothetical protein